MDDNVQIWVTLLEIYSCANNTSDPSALIGKPNHCLERRVLGWIGKGIGKT